jgi:hypothetical protein
MPSDDVIMMNDDLVLLQRPQQRPFTVPGLRDERELVLTYRCCSCMTLMDVTTIGTVTVYSCQTCRDRTPVHSVPTPSREEYRRTRRDRVIQKYQRGVHAR